MGRLLDLGALRALTAESRKKYSPIIPRYSPVFIAGGVLREEERRSRRSVENPLSITHANANSLRASAHKP